MGSFSIWHWLVILAIVILMFGSKKIRTLGSDLGAAVRHFRDSMQRPDESPAPPSELALPPTPSTAGASKEKVSG